MKTKLVLLVTMYLFLVLTALPLQGQNMLVKDSFVPPVSYENADKRADDLLSKLTLDEKILLIGGYSRFFIHSIPRLGIPYVFMTDATQGVRLDRRITDTTIVKKLPKTTAFPCPILLASTWNPELAFKYAKSVGEEAHAAGAGFLLGPGMNIYRISQNGRDFEYFGEDPYLVSRMIEKYVTGMQSTGTITTLKHFICNNTDFYRRRSNSIVDERALHEIYLPGFKAGVEAGAMAVMTSYNKLNGEWCGQNKHLITDVLRGELGFKGLVMTDWTSVYDGQKVIQSGQDLEMPELLAMKDAKAQLDSGKVNITDIDRMVKAILRTCIEMGFYDKPTLQDLSYMSKYPEHEKTALEVAHEGVVLLKNDNNILPIKPRKNLDIVVTGKYVKELAHGGGSAYVDGYNNVTLLDALKVKYSTGVKAVDMTDEASIRNANYVILSIGTFDYESADRSFDLPTEELAAIDHVISLNKNTIIVVNSGAGINMTPFADKVPVILYAWYGGQTGNTALADIIIGAVNPSGKLPITIERKFEDSPGYGYLPDYTSLSSQKRDDQFTRDVYDVNYKEGIFVGYRWYEHNDIKPLFAFGTGLSYTTFAYSNLTITPKEFSASEKVTIKFTVKNTGKLDGAEIAQLYIQDVQSSYPRPLKELKGFKKVFLKAGESEDISIDLNNSAFSYWNPDTKHWFAEPGAFNILVGSASDKIALQAQITLK